PLLWSLRTPVLYTANISVTDKCRVTDNYEMRFGVRNLQITREHGILLNGEHVRLNGVCMHHDLGALGAAVNRSAIRRQLEIMKDMGCNAIRTSHNPPAPEFLDLCDEMGFLVIDEAFDEWQLAKVENGYHTLFDEWAKRDLSDFIRRDRNHPCVMMWSIGNEIHEQSCPDGSKICRSLVEICHQLDQTRPVCAGFDQDFDAEKNGLCAAVDVVGLNYKPAHYAQHLLKHPDWILFGSETASCVSSRGRYYIPVNETHHPLHEDLHVSSYDVEAPHWANLPDYEFEGQDDNPQILGEFVWTGFDYLGEPTPYYSQWPSRSSYFGIVDLCGLKKDRFFAYQARWSGKPVMHVMPHWNWKRGMHVPIHCYTNFMCAELFVNGKSYGVRHKSFESTLARYRLIWDDIPYEPGKLDVISYDSNGHEAMRTSVRTAGDPSRIMLYPEKTVIPADAETYNWIRVQVEDDEGNVCPHADPMIIFSIDGAGELVACDNGDQTDLMPFYLPRRRATHGQCIVIVKANSPGEIVLSAKAENLDGIETVVCTAI
ncbi:MAG: glycoside hydrolase family 2 TIM barrel-domain containing protein, partial [Eubacteriales bacterium]|nr:glycoside hydrolase family 2 TIM barrel-domain containing protein [Eubacteriales bacterium]